jgi:hypothetical protein
MNKEDLRASEIIAKALQLSLGREKLLNPLKVQYWNGSAWADIAKDIAKEECQTFEKDEKERKPRRMIRI